MVWSLTSHVTIKHCFSNTVDIGVRHAAPLLSPSWSCAQNSQPWTIIMNYWSQLSIVNQNSYLKVAVDHYWQEFLTIIMYHYSSFLTWPYLSLLHHLSPTIVRDSSSTTTKHYWPPRSCCVYLILARTEHYQPWTVLSPFAAVVTRCCCCCRFCCCHWCCCCCVCCWPLTISKHQ